MKFTILILTTLFLIYNNIDKNLTTKVAMFKDDNSSSNSNEEENSDNEK